MVAEVSKPKLMDGCCCEGGAGMGYSRSGFEVEGYDLFVDYTQKRYPFKSWVMDIVDAIKERGHWYQALHASVPCQLYSITNAARCAEYPDLIGPVREAMIATGKPYVIENVVGAPLESPLMLCWSMFNEPGSVLDDDGTPLRMERHRLFESNVPLVAPGPCRHPKDVQVAGSYGGARRDKWEAKHVRKGGYVPSKGVQQQLLGIDWMTVRGMYQSVPPVYTEWIGKQLLEAL